MLREFRDESGVTWQVWDVYPIARGLASEADFGAGWLCFQCDNEKRRLAPIPSGWDICGAPELAHYCRQAASVTRPTPPASDVSD